MKSAISASYHQSLVYGLSRFRAGIKNLSSVIYHRISTGGKSDWYRRVAVADRTTEITVHQQIASAGSLRVRMFTTNLMNLKFNIFPLARRQRELLLTEGSDADTSGKRPRWTSNFQGTSGSIYVYRDVLEARLCKPA